jgi:hypothetical protein
MLLMGNSPLLRAVLAARGTVTPPCSYAAL